MIQEKKCKGQGKAKSVKGCGKLISVQYRKYGLCTSCYADFILNTDYGKILLEKATLKATRPRRELEKATAEKKEYDKLSTLLKSVEAVCHKYIRERDKYKPCVSCDNQWNKGFQAGHYYKAELYSTIKFNELNINGQCQQCNLRKDGNFNEYNLRLPKRIGQEQFNEITYLAEQDKKTDFKWDRSELIKIRDYYKLKLKQL